MSELEVALELIIPSNISICQMGKLRPTRGRVLPSNSKSVPLVEEEASSPLLPTVLLRRHLPTPTEVVVCSLPPAPTPALHPTQLLHGHGPQRW